ncbi:MAG TPA: hypothetical protein VHL59_12805 [Thermoanaerobaculia bacterium]|nr:hypothetical protein [Thermoanaerobaculia bacterium]
MISRVVDQVRDTAAGVVPGIGGTSGTDTYSAGVGTTTTGGGYGAGSESIDDDEEI